MARVSRTLGVLAALALTLGGVGAADPAPRSITAHTGAPHVDLRGGSPTRLDPRSSYETRSADDRLRIPPDRDPWSDSPDTRYGMFGQNRDTRVTFAVRADEDGRRRVRIDTNRNGDLRDDPLLLSEPIEFGQRVHAELQDPHVILALSFFDEESSETYNLSTNPGEKHDLSNRQAAGLEPFLLAQQKWLAEMAASRRPGREIELTPEEIQRLKPLGYVAD